MKSAYLRGTLKATCIKQQLSKWIYLKCFQKALLIFNWADILYKRACFWQNGIYENKRHLKKDSCDAKGHFFRKKLFSLKRSYLRDTLQQPSLNNHKKKHFPSDIQKGTF